MRDPNGKNPPKSPLGNHLIPGNPGNSGGKKGRSGRPSNAFRAFCEGILSDPATQEAIRIAAQNPKLAAFPGTVRFLAAYAHGQPQQTVTHEGSVTLTHEERKQSLERILGDRLKIA